MSPDSVVLEMFFVRFPFGDPAVNDKLWEAVDEQQFTPELRERLTRNGFRAGLVNGQIPDQLAKLMQLTDKPPPSGEPVSAKIDELESQPRVVRRHLQIRAGRRSEIIASTVYAGFARANERAGPALRPDLPPGQGIFSVRSFLQPDGRVRLQLVPELQHGQPLQRWIGEQGMMRLEASRPKRTFDDLASPRNSVPAPCSS